MTLYTWARRRGFPRLPEPQAATSTSRPMRGSSPTATGSRPGARRRLLRCTASRARARRTTCAGWPTRRSRAASTSCGSTSATAAAPRPCPGLYHSGLTADRRRDRALAATDGRTFGVAGYSLGGNLALKLAGEHGDDRRGAVAARRCAVSPTIELAPASTRSSAAPTSSISGISCAACGGACGARRGLARTLRHRRRSPACAPCATSTRSTRRRTTAFAGAADYYHRASALRVVDRMGVPALIIAADNDPFVPPERFAAPAVAGNPHIQVSSRATAAIAGSSAGRPRRRRLLGGAQRGGVPRRHRLGTEGTVKTDFQQQPSRRRRSSPGRSSTAR